MACLAGRRARSYKKYLMFYLIGIGIIICIIILLVLFKGGKPGVFSVQTKGRLTTADQNMIVSEWSEVKELVKLGRPSQLHQAILKSDTLLNHALKKLYPRARSTVERYQKAQEFFDSKRDYDDMWFAHKVRNEAAHAIDFELPHAQAVDVINKFEKSLKIIGVIN